MAKTTKTGITVSAPMMNMGGKDFVKNVHGNADDSGKRDITNPDSDGYVHDTYPLREGLMRPPVGVSNNNFEFFDIDTMRQQVARGERIWPETLINGAVAISNLIDRIIMRASSDGQYFSGDRRQDRIRELQWYIDMMINHIRLARELILMYGSKLEHNAVTRMNRTLSDLERYGTFATLFLKRNSTSGTVNSWIEQTGFQAPSAYTKGSKGLLGNCSTTGQVVTGFVVGAAIFALYKTCRK